MTRHFIDFEGRWLISRRIEDAKAGSSGSFDGVASFSPDGEGGFCYEEVGELRLPAGPNGPTAMQATRRYLWKADPDGVRVLFEDGRDFHRINLAQDTATGFHHCPPDDYEVSYNFSRWPNWRATWQVRGPRKDYMMITDYRR
ncbi:DUF6314 family protein [Aliiroseovarius sp. KMU-50]|uniref:DUF6314 family protein n=1 Tax=Aliiroseovarius salicola TaxID=3009082 RepID=A0ABT4W090_9RHOB|nr:DUF6314 family protein [Aliiroseovarius sp. KMU-50]MDA5093891.1 DUF6314 family protein [Aliiroseovarius sp. KMU-50]